MKRLLLVSTLAIMSVCAVVAQNVNDFRTVADGNWSNVAYWERYDGSSWVAATYYPGNGSTNEVTVSNSITLDVSISIPTLTIIGTLTGSGNNTLTTTGNLSCPGTLSWTDNAGGAISVQGNLTISGSFGIFNQNLTVNGTTTLNGNGTFTDGSDTGINQFSGTVTLNNASAFTSSAVTTTGRMIFGANFTHSSTGTAQIGTASIAGNLEVNSGTFSKTAAGTLTVTGTTTLNGSGALSITSNSQSDFVGKVTLNGSSTWTTTAVNTTGRLTLANGLEQNSTGTIQFGSCTFQTNAQSIAISNNTGNVSFANTVSVASNLTVDNLGDGTGAGEVRFNGDVTIQDNITLTSNRTIIIYGTLNGASATSTFVNNSTLEYRGINAPMTTGVFDVDNVGTTVNYSRDGNQIVTPATYHHLIVSREGSNTTLRTKTLGAGTTFTVNGNLTINEYNYLYFSSTTNNQTLTVAGNLELTATNSYLYTPNVDVTHNLVVNGYINNIGSIYLQYSTTRYTDVTLNGEGEILKGTGSFRFRNLTLTAANNKTSTASGNIDFYPGTSGNAFTNNGGTFTATAGTFRFMDSFSIAGSGDIAFNNLQCGNNNQTIQTLNRDVTVNGTLTLNHSNTANSYFDLNGYTLNVYGSFTRSNSGEFGSSNTASVLNLGNGNTPTVSGTLNFETGFNTLGTLNHNVVNGGTYYSIGSAVLINNFNIISGELRSTANTTIRTSWSNNGTYSQTANTTYFDNSGNTITINGNGINSFWNLEISAGTTVTTANDIYIKANLVVSSNASPAFNATGGTVYFSQTGGTQYIQGSGTGETNFNNLIFNSTGNKYIARDINVTNTLTVEAVATTVYIESSANRTINANNLTVNGRLYVQDAGSVSHSVNVSGALSVGAGAYLYLWRSTTRYADLTLTGSGDVISGSGSIFYIHSITFNNPNQKFLSYSGNIELFGGTLTPNAFINNGDLLQAPSITFRFRGNDQTYTISGTGDIAFGTVSIGANTRTNVILNRDISVDGNLIFNLSDAANYLDLNGYTLTLNGNHTRTNNGRIRGGGTGNMVINGSGSFTSTFAFDQTTPGTTNRLASLTINRGASGEMWLANLMEVDNLTITDGILNSRAGSILVHSSATINGGAFIDNANGGTNTFNGTLTVNIGGKFTPTSTSALSLSGNIQNYGDFNKTGGGNTTFTGNTTIQGDSAVFFGAGAVLVNDGVTVTNQITSGSGVYIYSSLNGNGATATWANQGILTYLGANEPMATGVLDASYNPNTVIYNRDLNNQYIKNTTYHNLHLLSGGYRQMRLGDVTINGNLLIGEENIFYTWEYQVYGNATGTLTMLNASELRIGRDVPAATNVFPTGFVRANIILDPNSLVTYNGQTQNVSHEPIYENLAITNAGNKTITGNITVNGYLRMTAGTLVFGTTLRNITVYGDLLASGGRIDMSGGGLAHELNLYGEVNQANRFSNAANSIVRYLSTANQMIFSPTGGDWYGNLVIDGGSTKFLEGSVQVRTNINLASGIVQLNDFDLTLYRTATISGTFSATNMIETNGSGKLSRIFNAGGQIPGVYPVGSKGKYTPITINSITVTGTGDRTLSFRAVPERHPSVSSSYDALIRYWDVTASTGYSITAADVNFTYSPLDVIGDDTKYNVYRWDGAAFTSPAGSSIASNTMYVPTAQPLTGQWTAYDPLTVRQTLYSYKDGDWNDPDTWTTDPAGQLLVGSRVPASSDNVVILQGRNVYLTSNLNTRGLVININDGGTLDLRNYAFNEVVSILEGQGTLKLATNQMPNVAVNNIVEPGGGTVEYNVPDAAFDLNNQPNYYNLKFNLPNASNVATLLNNLTVYGNLIVDRGVFKIYKDDPTSTIYSRIKIDIQGDLLVNSNGSIRTGTASTHDATLPAPGTSPGSAVPRYYDVYHQVYIKGSLKNNGSIRFVSDDINTFRFDTLTTRGATTVRFYGTDNQVAECFGQTDFYNLIIDKGINQSVELNINASAPENFRLFGCNRYPIPTYGVNPELRKALWIRNGTLRLSGMVTIPTLTEGLGVAGTGQTSYFIPVNGALVIDDRDVTVLISADDNAEVTAAWGLPSQGVHMDNTRPQELYLYGKLQINEGYLSSRFSGGILFGDQGGELVVNDGKLSTRQIRTGNAGAASFAMYGGEVEILGRYTYDVSGVTNAASLQTVPYSLVENGSRLDGTAAFNFATSAGLFTMTGGTMRIYNTSGGGGSRAFRLMTTQGNTTVSDAGIVYLEIIRNTQYDIECPNAMLPSLTVNRNASSGTNGARLYSDVKVSGNIILSGYGILQTNTPNYNLTVSGNLTIGSNATYTPGLNRTIFNGNSNTTFTVNGTISGDLYSMEVNKPSSTLTLAGTNGNINLNGELSLLSGTLNDGGYTITARGNIVNSATHTGLGKILIAGALANRTIGGNGNGIFGNVEFNEAVDILSTLTANQRITGNLTFTNGSINLDRFSLTLDGNLTPNIQTGYTIQTLIRTRGEASDGGFVRKINANGDYLFPVGTNTDGTERYTPSVITVSNFADDGYITVIPVLHELPTLDQTSSGDALQYYWRVKQTGFTAQPTIACLYTYVENDVLGDENLYVPGRIEGATRIAETSGVDAANNTISFPDHTLTNADYTAAKTERFQGSVRIFYSRVTDGNWYSHAWHDGNNWSFESHTGVAAGTYPTAGDIAIIGYGGHASNGGYHSIMVMNGTAECAELRFNSNPSGYQSRLVIDSDAAASLGKVSGIGTFMMWINPTQIPTVDADFTEFNNEATSVFNYYQHQDGTVNIPTSFTTYPNLRFEGGGGTLGNRIAIIDADILVKRNLTVDSNGILRLSSGSTGNITVEGTTNIGGYLAGIIEFPTDAERTLTTAQLNLTSNANNRLRVLNSTPNGFVNTVRVTGTGITQNDGAIDLFNGNSGDNNAILEFTGTSNATFTKVNGSNPDLYRVVVNKGTNQTPTCTITTAITLGAPTDLSTKSIVLQNGTLVLSNASNAITLSSGGAYFSIPSTSALRLSDGTYTITSNNNGIALYGKLRIDGNATLDLGDGTVAETRNIIYYNNVPELQVADNATLQVQTQIRRTGGTLAGSLRYTQTGGNVVIQGRNLAGGRALLEVCNSGSQFNMSGGTITFRRGGATTFGDLYLVPSSSSVTGGEIIFSQGTLNANYTYSINVTPTLNNVTIAGNTTNNRTATVKLMTDPLRIAGLFKFDNNLAAFNSNNRHTYLYGNLQFNGTWTYGTTDSVVFAGTVQTISGSPTFNHMKVRPTTSVTLAASSSPVVNGILHIAQGQLIDGENAITVKGNYINNGSHISSNPANSATGIKLKGSVLQEVSGTGTFGLMELDNLNGAKLLNDITLPNNLTLTTGVFNIGSYKLSLGVNAQVVAPSGFTSTRMILTDGVYGNNAGIEKTIPTGASTFTFPIGVYGKYTPVELTVNQNSSQGQILVKPVNTVHVGVLDPSRVLQYWWYVNSTGISNFEGQAVMTYVDSDVLGDENSYVSARLTNDIWAKVSGAVDAVNNTITFSYPTGTSSLLGDYLAGEDPAIGDSIITYYSENSGVWDNAANWSRSDGGIPSANGPYGVKVVIRPQHTISTNGNRRTTYRMTINGRLEVGTTYGHNFSTVLGTGTLALESNTLPAGKYDDFITCTGGGVEYGGTSSYTLYNTYNTYRKLIIAGSGTKTLPNINMTICDTLAVLNTATLATQANRTITLNGNLIKDATALLDAEPSGQTFELRSTGNQVINATLNAVGNRFNNLSVYNNKEVTLQGPTNVATYLRLYDASVVNTTPANILKLERIDGLNSVSTSAFVRGPLMRILANGSAEHQFPVGYLNHKKNTNIVAPAGSSNSYWTVEYKEQNPNDYGYNPLSVEPGLSQVTSTEFWIIKGPNTYTARLKLVLDGTSDVANTITNLNNLRIVRWSGTRWEIVGGTVTITGNAASGTLTCNSTITFNGTDQIFTIGSVEPATAEFTDGDTTICAGQTVPIEVTFAKGTPPYSITYTENGVNPQTINGITDNPYTFNVTPFVTTTYQLTAMSHAGGAGVIVGSPVTVSVYPRPNVNIDVSTSICSGDDALVTVTLTSGISPFSFTYSVDGVNDPAINNVTSPHSFTKGPMIWVSAGSPPSPYTDYLFRVEQVVDGHGCVNDYTIDLKPSDTLRVYKIPETGPTYHVPNNYAF
ncbi:MAG: hypothetical protein WHS63_05335 [Tenuifilum sp.]|uniref:beta strand repeat-containing protein n=1 Tax=Tenuifilum sp. TaxID=2760880 RepID=UPI00309F0BA6